jgi:hypothetical protein
MRLLYLLTGTTLLHVFSLNAQEKKISDHFIGTGFSGGFRDWFDRESRILFINLYPEYQWRFSSRFSIGISGLAGYEKSGTVSNERRFRVTPEVRFWLPLSTDHLQPFIYLNYGPGRSTRELNGTSLSTKINGGGGGLGILWWFQQPWGIQGKFNILNLYDGGVSVNANILQMQMGVFFRPGQRKKADKEQPKQ